MSWTPSVTPQSGSRSFSSSNKVSSTLVSEVRLTSDYMAASLGVIVLPTIFLYPNKSAPLSFRMGFE
jgi:hypothetical protein